MTVTAKPLLQATQLAAGETTLYVTPASTKTIVDKCTVTNPTGSAATITMRVVVSGGTGGTTNTVIPAKSIAAGDTYVCPEVVGQILSAGDFITGIPGTAAALNVRISGREIT